jgi:dihydrodipicolinate synthase/N-acetylneuraminate lyase
VLLRVSKVVASEHAIAGVKFAMNQRGYRGGIPRLPLVPLSEAYEQRISESLASLQPLVARV